jgi:hypothetical protein
MNNEVIHDAWVLPVVVTDPATPQGGDPCRWGFLTGVAVDDENAAGVTVVDFGQRVHTLSVVDRGGGGIAVGETLFYADATNDIDDVTTGTPFGYAMEIVGAGLTASIHVLHVPGHGAATLGAGVVSVANLAANAVETAKINADAVTTAKINADAVTTVKILNANVTLAKLAASSVDGSKGVVLADANTTGVMDIIHRFDISAGALAAKNIVLDRKERVIDAWLVLTGAGVANTTFTVETGAGTAITDAMAGTGADKALVRCATLDDAQWDIAGGGTLRVESKTGATQPAATVFVRCIPVA